MPRLFYCPAAGRDLVVRNIASGNQFNVRNESNEGWKTCVLHLDPRCWSESYGEIALV